MGIGIDSIYAQHVPAQHPQLFAVLAIKFTANETRRDRSFEMHLQDADGQEVIPPITRAIHVNAPAEGMTYRTQRIVNGMYGITFSKFGDYQVSWIMDSREVHTVHFRVIQRAAD